MTATAPGRCSLYFGQFGMTEPGRGVWDSDCRVGGCGALPALSHPIPAQVAPTPGVSPLPRAPACGIPLFPCSTAVPTGIAPCPTALPRVSHGPTALPAVSPPTTHSQLGYPHWPPAPAAMRVHAAVGHMCWCIVGAPRHVRVCTRTAVVRLFTCLCVCVLRCPCRQRGCVCVCVWGGVCTCAQPAPWGCCPHSCLQTWQPSATSDPTQFWG